MRAMRQAEQELPGEPRIARGHAHTGACEKKSQSQMPACVPAAATDPVPDGTYETQTSTSRSVC